MVASSLLVAQPAAADMAYTVHVTFDAVQFTMVDDGCAGFPDCVHDPIFELYGVVGAYTTAGASSAQDGVPYRLFGKWGSHPCESYWNDNSGMPCTKEVSTGTYLFRNVFLCGGSYYQTCSTGYSKDNETITLQVHPGEQFKVTVLMQDYDALSSDDVACKASQWFGPYTAAELQARKWTSDVSKKPLQMPYNGNGECLISYYLW